MGKASEHRAALIVAAVKLFRRRGYAGTGLNDILALSGVPKGSLYHYFPKGKAELGAAAVTAAGRTISHTLREIADEARTTHAFVTRYAQMLEAWLAASAFRDGCPLATTLLETAAEEPGIAAAGEAAYGDHAAIIASMLRRDGLGSAGAARAAEAILAALQGALLLCRVQKSAGPLRRVADTVPRALVRSTRTGRASNVTTS